MNFYNNLFLGSVNCFLGWSFHWTCIVLEKFLSSGEINYLASWFQCTWVEDVVKQRNYSMSKCSAVVLCMQFYFKVVALNDFCRSIVERNALRSIHWTPGQVSLCLCLFVCLSHARTHMHAQKCITSSDWN